MARGFDPWPLSGCRVQAVQEFVEKQETGLAIGKLLADPQFVSPFEFI